MVIGATPLVGFPLVGEGRVLATSIALPDETGLILVQFVPGVVVAELLAQRSVRNEILMVHHYELIGKSLVREVGVVQVTDSELAEVNHLSDFNPVADQHHGCELSPGSAKTVTRSFDIIGRVEFLKALNLSEDIVLDEVSRLEVGFVNQVVSENTIELSVGCQIPFKISLVIELSLSL